MLTHINNARRRSQSWIASGLLVGGGLFHAKIFLLKFEVKIQASFGGRIIAAERISARRKDVIGYLYGGDVTRKMKLLKKQKEGKKRMAAEGHVHIPSETYFEVFKVA